jgi:CubicO group peptidase (beta-lactamase class C family)
MKRLLSLLVCYFWITTVQTTYARTEPLSLTPNINTALLDQVVLAQMEKHALPGISLAVIEGDQIVYLKGYGTAGDHPMTPQTQMFIGSQSKSVTALVIAQLAEEGLIDLNKPVQTYIPWFRVADDKASEQISINHLLHHTSGLSGSGFDLILPANTTPEAAVRALAQAEVTAPVGTAFQYFNEGYDVLSFVIETVTGEQYADVVQDRVFDPLGMDLTTADPATATDLSSGYTRLFGFPVPIEQPVRDYEIGAGYIVSTAEDMARYALAIKDGAVGLVSPQMYQTIITPGLADYGMGWHIVDGGRKIFHGGANETFASHVNIYPKIDRAYVLLINEGSQIDHFISSAQLNQAVEAVVLGSTPPPVSAGASMRWIGGGIGLVVLTLSAVQIRSFKVLFGKWVEETRAKSNAKKVWEVAFSFLLPTAILMVAFSQVSAFYGNRFNLLPSLVYMRLGLPDIFILMLLGSVPDYLQGMIKLNWVLTGKLKPQASDEETSNDPGGLAPI